MCSLPPPVTSPDSTHLPFTPSRLTTRVSHCGRQFFKPHALLPALPQAPFLPHSSLPPASSHRLPFPFRCPCQQPLLPNATLLIISAFLAPALRHCLLLVPPSRSASTLLNRTSAQNSILVTTSTPHDVVFPYRRTGVPMRSFPHSLAHTLTPPLRAVIRACSLM